MFHGLGSPFSAGSALPSDEGADMFSAAFALEKKVFALVAQFSALVAGSFALVA